MVIDGGFRWRWRQKHAGVGRHSTGLSQSFLKFALLLFLVEVCVDKDVSEVTEPDAGTMLKSGLVSLFVLFSLGVSLDNSAANTDLKRE